MNTSSDKDSIVDPEETVEDVAKRRSKNRVNARRSRERKRLMLDTLQQEHWQLHQENKKIKGDNEKLREAIQTIKSLQSNQSLPNQVPQFSGAPASAGRSPPAQQTMAPAPAPTAPAPSQAPSANSILELLAQQMLAQQQGNGGSNGLQGLPQQFVQASTQQQQPNILTNFLLANMLNGANQSQGLSQNSGMSQQSSQNQAPAPAPQENKDPLSGLNALLMANNGRFQGNQMQQPQQQQQPQQSNPNLASLLQALGQKTAQAPSPPPQAQNMNPGLAALLQSLGQAPSSMMPQMHQFQQHSALQAPLSMAGGHDASDMSKH